MFWNLDTFYLINFGVPKMGFLVFFLGRGVRFYLLLYRADLLSTATRVCSRWRDTICSPHFMPYKKLYYAYKKGRGDQFLRAKIELENESRKSEHFMDAVTACFVGFIQKLVRHQHYLLSILYLYKRLSAIILFVLFCFFPTGWRRSFP